MKLRRGWKYGWRQRDHVRLVQVHLFGLRLVQRVRPGRLLIGVQDLLQRAVAVRVRRRVPDLAVGGRAADHSERMAEADGRSPAGDRVAERTGVRRQQPGPAGDHSRLDGGLFLRRVHRPRSLGLRDSAGPPFLGRVEDAVDSLGELLDAFPFVDHSGVQLFPGLLEGLVQLQAGRLVRALAELQGRCLDHPLGVRVDHGPGVRVESDPRRKRIGGGVPGQSQERRHPLGDLQGPELEVIPIRPAVRQIDVAEVLLPTGPQVPQHGQPLLAEDSPDRCPQPIAPRQAVGIGLRVVALGAQRASQKSSSQVSNSSGLHAHCHWPAPGICPAAAVPAALRPRESSARRRP